ncbi:uncharacterized protein P884DRAFT_260944 [Thermothelomyces heterothallicus CBS 202.75]|uniref:uncharacterized protein n=1 Tax=Thermothelomyces heterothallicus CBS 202.75 TaxID=1149848 RepID=UPI00374348F3
MDAQRRMRSVVNHCLQSISLAVVSFLRSTFSVAWSPHCSPVDMGFPELSVHWLGCFIQLADEALSKNADWSGQGVPQRVMTNAKSPVISSIRRLGSSDVCFFKSTSPPSACGSR